jgi:gliding motility-associated-like protein
MKLKLLIALFFCKALVFGQIEASNWYFGYNAGMLFDVNGNVTALEDGKLETNEGCSTISDELGNLLFYTDGRTVYDRNHTIMPNGNYFAGTGLFGDPSSTQSAIIVPKPGDPNIYFIFTTDEPHHENSLVYPNAFSGTYVEFDGGTTPIADDGLNNGLNYSIVDLSIIGINGSIGDIVSRNNHLITYDTNPLGQEIKFKCPEKLTAVRNESKTGFWILSHFKDKFYAYQLDASGLNTTPIITTIAPLIKIDGYRRNAIGCMKASPDGKKIAIAHNQNQSNLGSEVTYDGMAYLYDFDNNTGIISNAQLIKNSIDAYGIEFSENSNVLYLSNDLNILQYDLTATNINLSQFVVYQYASFGLQIGPNNKIYVINGSTLKLGVINNPNILGFGCDFQFEAVDLGTGNRALGLPSYVTSFFNPEIIIENLCLGDTTNFTINSSQPILNATWNFDDGTTSSTPNATHQFATAGTYNVSVTATTANGTSTKNKTVKIFATPIIASTVVDQDVCSLINQNNYYDFSQHNSTLLDLQPTATFGVAYFNNANDLVNHSNILSNSFILQTGTTTFYAKVFNLQNTNCYANTSFNVTLFKQPIANTLTDYVICENMPYNNIEQFDLSTKNAQLLGNQSASQFAISYYASQNDADIKTAPLPILYNNVLPSENIYYRIENINNSKCFATKKLTIKVIQQPNSIAVSDFKKCDDTSNNGIESFDLSLKTIEILNGQSDVVFQVKYYKNNTDATNNTSEITNPITNTSNNQTIYYVISAIGNLGCKTISSFNLVVNQLPKIIAVKDIFNCDDSTNDGFGVFDLQSNNALILGSQAANDFEIKYYFSQADADSGNAPLAFNYPNISNPQTIFARIQNTNNSVCFTTKSFQIGLYKLPKANQPNHFITCDDNSNNSKESFDLAIQNSKILLLQNAADFNITYHTNTSDANSGLNFISNTFTNTSNPQTIYARIENKLNKTCFDTTTFDLIVRDKPTIIMPDNYSICEGKNVSVTAPPGFTSYNWSNGSTIPLAVFTSAGDYILTVTKDYGDIICNDTKNIKIYNSNIATITSIEIQDWTDNENLITVYVSGDGDYEYSIDGNTYQDSQQFFGLPNGKYTVYVKDKRGCGIAKAEDVFLLMYPKFFTPNADGVNDNWQIKFSEIEPNMKLTIFDRFGKLITEFEGNNLGWNGDLNNNKLPSDDYWFVVNRENGKEYNGHFSLKR